MAVPGAVQFVEIPRAVAWGKALLVGAIFLALGVGAAVVPPHLPQLVLLPSIGLFLAFHLFGQRARLGVVRWRCAACGAEAEVDGRGEVWGADSWVRCPGCGEPVRVAEG